MLFILFHTSMQKGLKKKKSLSQRLQRKKSRLTCVVLVWCFLSWLCSVKRRAETSISPALLDKPPLPLLSFSLSLSLPSSLSLSLSHTHNLLSPTLLTRPPCSFFSVTRCFSSICLFLPHSVSSLNLLLPLKQLQAGNPPHHQPPHTYTQ